MSQVCSQALTKIPAEQETAVILAIPVDSIIFLREILKFLGTAALIAATGLLLLLAG
ncbi:MAG: hypothetical protein ACOZF2_19315 [Thermodesulfobacteriota bacterium]